MTQVQKIGYLSTRDNQASPDWIDGWFGPIVASG